MKAPQALKAFAIRASLGIGMATTALPVLDNFIGTETSTAQAQGLSNSEALQVARETEDVIRTSLNTKAGKAMLTYVNHSIEELYEGGRGNNQTQRDHLQYRNAVRFLTNGQTSQLGAQQRQLFTQCLFAVTMSYYNILHRDRHESRLIRNLAANERERIRPFWNFLQDKRSVYLPSGICRRALG